MNLIIVGFKRAGKTQFGKTLARHLQRPFIDTDRLLEAKTRLSCRKLYAALGEAGFRTLEKETLKELSATKNSVIAVGGGAILDPENRALLTSLGHIIYLRLDKAVLKARMLAPPLPAFLDPTDPEGSFEALYAARLPIYEGPL